MGRFDRAPGTKWNRWACRGFGVVICRFNLASKFGIGRVRVYDDKCNPGVLALAHPIGR